MMNRFPRKLTLFLSSITLLTFVFTGHTAACQCAGSAAPCQAYWKTDVVFVGTVVGSTKFITGKGDYKSEQRLVRFNVVEAFRGVQTAQAEVITGWGGGDCGYGFESGQSYIVYAYRSEKDKRLYTSICSRTRSLAEASEDLNYIHSLPNAEASPPSSAGSSNVTTNGKRTEKALSLSVLPS